MKKPEKKREKSRGEKKGKKRDWISIVIIIIIILSAPLTIYLASLNTYLFDKDYYIDHFRNNMIYDDVPDANETLSQLLDYFKSPGDAEPDIEGFNERERTHLLDVKNLIHTGSFVFFCLLALKIILITVLVRRSGYLHHHLALVFIGSGLMTILFSAAFMLGEFASRFTQFHNMFFKPGTWIFSSTDLLIRMFPYRFFYETTFRIITSSLTVSLMLILLGSAFFILNQRQKLR